MNTTISSPEALLKTGIDSYMDTNVAASVIKETEPLQTALEALRKSPGRLLYTTTEAGALSGVISQMDLVRLTGEGDRPQTAAALATKEKVVGVRRNAELWQLLKILNGENAQKKSFDQLPILDSENKPVGIVSRNALREALGKIQLQGPGAAGMGGG